MTDREKVIAAYECSNEKLPDERCDKCPYGYEYLDQTGDNYFVGCNTERIMVDAIDLLKAQEPVAVKHIHEEYPEHVWKKDENGKIDEWASEDSESTHHGPVCERCLDSFCVACEPNGYETHKKCIIDDYVCPICGQSLWKNQKHCDKCGQAVKWE